MVIVLYHYIMLYRSVYDGGHFQYTIIHYCKIQYLYLCLGLSLLYLKCTVYDKCPLLKQWRWIVCTMPIGYKCRTTTAYEGKTETACTINIASFQCWMFRPAKSRRISRKAAAIKMRCNYELNLGIEAARWIIEQIKLKLSACLD